MKYLYAYRNIAAPATVGTLLGAYGLLTTPTAAVFLYLFWCKLFVSAILVAYIHFFQRGIVMFFMNLGIGKIELYSSMIAIDLFFFILLLTIILLFF